MRIPTTIKLHKASRTLELEYGADERYLLRMRRSPSSTASC